VSSPNQVLERVVRKLATRCDLDEADRDAILALPHVQRSFNATAYIVSEGEPPRKALHVSRDQGSPFARR
jgi:hypothetical protein